VSFPGYATSAATSSATSAATPAAPYLSMLAGWGDEPAADVFASPALAAVPAADPYAHAYAGSGAGAAGDPAWRLDALCAETDPEAFFPEKGGSTREAKRVCSGCAVRSECLEYALANDERFGIWGGLSERERRRVRLARRMPLSA
jgi:WhiB family redox-sensing transcriptional regulator